MRILLFNIGNSSYFSRNICPFLLTITKVDNLKIVAQISLSSFFTCHSSTKGLPFLLMLYGSLSLTTDGIDPSSEECVIGGKEYSSGSGDNCRLEVYNYISS